MSAAAADLRAARASHRILATGGLVMALGGMLSLWGRLRVRVALPAAAQTMPAE